MDLGDRPDMLDRDIVKHHDFSEYLSKLYRFTQPEGYRDSNGRTIPQEAMAVYVNLHLSDSIGAWRKTKEQLARIDSEIASKAFTGSADLNHIYHNMRNLAGIWYTQMQNTYSRKLWIDYDIDLIDTGLKEKTAGNVRKLFSSPQSRSASYNRDKRRSSCASIYNGEYILTPMQPTDNPSRAHSSFWQHIEGNRNQSQWHAAAARNPAGKCTGLYDTDLTASHSLKSCIMTFRGYACTTR